MAHHPDTPEDGMPPGGELPGATPPQGPPPVGAPRPNVSPHYQPPREYGRYRLEVIPALPLSAAQDLLERFDTEGWEVVSHHGIMVPGPGAASPGQQQAPRTRGGLFLPGPPAPEEEQQQAPPQIPALYVVLRRKSQWRRERGAAQ